MPATNMHGYPVSREKLDHLFPVMWDWVTDRSPTDRPFKARALLVERWGKDLTGAFLRECAALPWPADRIVRVGQGRYEWRFAQCADADSIPGTYRTPNGRLVRL